MILEQACRTVDLIGTLDAAVRRDGPVVQRGKHGDPAPHPAAVEGRQQRLTLARLLTALRLPDGDGVRPQGRGLRGVYASGSAAREVRAAGGTARRR